MLWVVPPLVFSVAAIVFLAALWLVGAFVTWQAPVEVNWMLVRALIAGASCIGLIVSGAIALGAYEESSRD